MNYETVNEFVLSTEIIVWKVNAIQASSCIAVAYLLKKKKLWVPSNYEILSGALIVI